METIYLSLSAQVAVQGGGVFKDSERERKRERKGRRRNWKKGKRLEKENKGVIIFLSFLGRVFELGLTPYDGIPTIFASKRPGHEL